MKALGMVSSYSTIFRRIRLVIAWEIGDITLYRINLNNPLSAY
jgi:hypothetical protein